MRTRKLLSYLLCCAALLLAGCYYKPISESAKGNLTCYFGGRRAFVGDIRIVGMAITDGIHTFSPSGTWTLCGDNPGLDVKCEVNIRTSSAAAR